VLDALAAGVQLEGGVHYRPAVDGHVLPASTGDLLEAGAGAGVPFLIGNSADEGSIYAASLGFEDVAAYEDWIASEWPDDAGTVLERYPAEDDTDVAAAASALITDWLYVCPARRAARAVAASGVPVWRYHFTHVPPEAAEDGRGAYHGAELPYVFHHARAGWTDDDVALADELAAAWSGFAATGEAPWEPFVVDDGEAYRVLDVPGEDAGDLAADACDMWDLL
jgi:para-nitrobenzyl esterase